MVKTREQLVNQAMAALECDDFTTIKHTCSELVARFPDQDTAVFRLWAAACFHTGELIKAEQLLTQGLTIETNAANYYNLALVKQALHKEQEALDAYLTVIHLAPDMVDAYNNLANIYASQHQFELAQHYYQAALALDPNYLLTLKNLALLYKQTQQISLAKTYLKQMLSHSAELTNEFQDAWNEWGLIAETENNLREAEEAFRKANALSSLQRILRKTVQWSESLSIDQQIIAGIKNNALGIEPFTIINTQGLTRSLHKQAAKQSARQRFNISTYTLTPTLDLRPDKKLTIGYISADFRDHAVTRLLIEVLEKHHFLKFNFILYSYSPKQNNIYTERLAQLPFPMKDINLLSDEQAAKLIAADKVDLLIDLQGHTGSSRLAINALRPAPVIVNWLGYPGTLGEPLLADYIIADKVITPVTHADDYSEVLALMPNCYQPNDTKKIIAQQPTRAMVGLAQHAFVFCSFNQTVKYNAETFNLWCQLLSQHPTSQLWLLDPANESAKQHLQAEAKLRGIAPNRLIFAPIESAANHYARLSLADLALDTFPFNSHTTASDALWMGVPLITKEGELFASRVAASILTAFGLPELITHSDEEYLALANKLITDKEYYQHIKQRTMALRYESTLFDSTRFTNDLEQLYQQIWRRYCTNKQDRSPITISSK